MSDVGLVRDHNEDVWAVYPDIKLYIVADGMGGHAAGEIAAQESITRLHELVQSWRPSNPNSVEEATAFFKEALIKVNATIYQKGQSEPSLSGMGTTICSLYLMQDHAILSHIGDSRIYRMRKRKIEQLTQDHSLVAELVALGTMKADASETFPYKHVLTRAIGTRLPVEPTVNAVSVENEDGYFLCTDGLTNYVEKSEIEEILNRPLSLQEQAQLLINLANAHGGGDNITLVILKINHDLSR